MSSAHEISASKLRTNVLGQRIQEDTEHKQTFTQIGAGRVETGSLAGQILNVNGAALAGVRVSIIPVHGEMTTPEAGAALSLGSTDRNGRYSISGIAPGRYVVFHGSLDSPTSAG
jgi:protocatechuate 3,4-dioxygenase beta subunit